MITPMGQGDHQFIIYAKAKVLIPLHRTIAQYMIATLLTSTNLGLTYICHVLLPEPMCLSNLRLVIKETKETPLAIMSISRFTMEIQLLYRAERIT